jgi:hypothetical protein
MLRFGKGALSMSVTRRVASLAAIGVIGGLLLAGCTTNYAVYRHPVTGDVLECEQTSGAYGGNTAFMAPYADCKTSLEQRGYVRTGTVQRAPRATSLSETATPRPAPR